MPWAGHTYGFECKWTESQVINVAEGEGSGGVAVEIQSKTDHEINKQINWQIMNENRNNLLKIFGVFFFLLIFVQYGVSVCVFEPVFGGRGKLELEIVRYVKYK